MTPSLPLTDRARRGWSLASPSAPASAPASLATTALVMSWLFTACAAPADSAGDTTSARAEGTVAPPAAPASLPTYARPAAGCTGPMFPPFDYRGDSLFADERSAMSAASAASAGPVVTRDGPQLRITLGARANRPALVLRFHDCRADDGEMNVRFVYQGTGPAGRGHVLLRGHYEGADVLWVSDSTGGDTVLPVLPVFAPDGAHFVIANADLESGYTANAFELWAVRGSEITRVVAVPMHATAGTEAPVWEHAGAVRADLVERDANGATTRRVALRLQRRGERWLVDTVPRAVPPTP